MWFFLLVRVCTDLFRDRDVSGRGKAGWSVFLIALPFLGVFVYLIARGKGMAERQVQEAKARDSQFRAHARDTANEPSGSYSGEQLARLVELRDHGDLTEEEYQRAKSKVLTACSGSTPLPRWRSSDVGATLELELGVVTMHVPDTVKSEAEAEVGDGEVELEIELSWATASAWAAASQPLNGRRRGMTSFVGQADRGASGESRVIPGRSGRQACLGRRERVTAADRST